MNGVSWKHPFRTKKENEGPHAIRLHDIGLPVFHQRGLIVSYKAMFGADGGDEGLVDVTWPAESPAAG